MIVEALPPAFGGAARQALQLAAHLRDQGVEVFFLGSQIVPGSPPEDRLNEFRVYRVPFSTNGKWNKLRGLLGACRVLARQRHEFDVLHLHACHYLTLTMAVFARVALRRPFVIKLTSINFDTPSAVKRQSYGALSWLFYRQAGAYVCMSTAQWRDCVEHGLPGQKLHRIPNGVNTQQFRPVSSEAERQELLARLGLSSGFHYAVFIGTIERDKGVELLVDAAQRVCAARRDVKFLLIGPHGGGVGEKHVRPEFVVRIREKIRSAGLDDRVLLLGQRSTVREYLQVATCFVFASRSEGFGTVLIEAMASGLPCVALNIPDVTTDIITPGRDGVVIDNEDPAGFAEAILKLLQDEAWRRQLSSAARQSVVDRFGFSAIARQYATLYGTVAGAAFWSRFGNSSASERQARSSLPP